MAGYRELYERSLRDPEGFWGEEAEAITWHRRWDRVLDDSEAPFYRWFTGGQLNTAYNCLDRHADGGRGEQPALIHDSPVTGTQTTYTYAQLRDAVARFAGVLRGLGVGHGDRVIVYMPMIPEAAIAMLACARIGAVHSVVFGGFAGAQLAKRIDDAEPKALVTASCGIEPGGVVDYKHLYEHALSEAAHAPTTVVVKQRERQPCELVNGRDHDWDSAMAHAAPADPVPVAATDPLYILYTSGTTGWPKGVVRDNGGHAVALHWTMKGLYGIDPGEVFWTASDVGWVVGHSYIVYGPLLRGATTVMFEGKPVGTPDAGAFWRVIEEHGVAALFTAPTAFRAIRQRDPEGREIAKHDLRGFRTLFLAGERCDPDTFVWAQNRLNVPVVDHWWQTETGWAIAGNPMGIEPMPVKPGSACKPMPGWDVRVLDEGGAELGANEVGAIACKLPLPPGTLPSIWGSRDRFYNEYLSTFPGFYRTGDAGMLDSDGDVWVMGRLDDVINVAGHRLSTGAIEEALANHPDVAECAVMGVHDDLKGQVPVGLVVLTASCDRDSDAVAKECVQQVREEVGPVAAFKHVAVVPRLPKTRSGKILRGTMRKLADGEEPTVPPTIDDPAILDEVRHALADLRKHWDV
ncbi:propionyl-CoA synthetase [Limimonas halophila]|uniref:Propionyl-CoA synthetase n=2 Tax=Limimonas halophila TaxID=1082479 RepID=A0A1G7PU94_9PROT|nr:propionyl-CoA synthetase [Limimonas halophila]